MVGSGRIVTRGGERPRRQYQTSHGLDAGATGIAPHGPQALRTRVDV